MNIDKDLASALATPLLLTILSEGESYGYAILKRVRELSGGELEWADGRSALANRQRPWVAAMRALSSMWRGPGWLLTALGSVTDCLQSLTADWHATAALACLA